jgi:low affinity Fe/Cu permease
MRDKFGKFARTIARVTSSPAATVSAILLVVAWAATGRLFHFSDTWQLVMNTVSAVVTFLMVFVLNNAQARDTGALNAKLDALILAVDAADNRAIAVEQQSDSTAAKIQADIRGAANKA